MKRKKLTLVQIYGGNFEFIATFDTGDLRKDWEEAYEMRDGLQLEPTNLNEQRFAVRWV